MRDQEDAAKTRDAVREFCAQQLGVRLQNLESGTSLLHDLGVDGDDAAELVEEFSRRFEVDMSGYRHDQHFGSEAGCNPFSFLFALTFRRDVFLKIPITIDDLVAVALAKKWEQPRRPIRGKS